MAFENGYRVEDYIGEVIHRFRKDPAIFHKVYQIMPVFMSRSDWPHCFNEFDETVRLIIGDSLAGLIFGFTSRYLHNEQIEWPEDLPDGFIDELELLDKSVSDIVNQYWLGRTSPMKLYSVAKSSAGNKNIIRLIRADGEALDLEVDDDEISKIIQSLEQIKRLSDNE